MAGPTVSLSLVDHAPSADLASVILSATMDLDPAGEAGSSPVSPDGADADMELPDATIATVGTDPEQLGRALTSWAHAHAHELGLEPNVAIALSGIHVTYRTASDRLTRPKIVLQFSQRRVDLEDQQLDENARTIMRVGTTVIAGVDGRVRYVVAKPLPFLDPDCVSDLSADAATAAREYHRVGEERLRALRTWLEEVEDRDALSAWTDEPALHRLTFANLHSVMDTAAN